MKKSDINCVLDEVYGSQYGVRESNPVRYILELVGENYKIYEANDLRYFDPEIYHIDTQFSGSMSPKEFIDWYING